MKSFLLNRRTILASLVSLILLFPLIFIIPIKGYAEEFTTPVLEDPIDEDWVEYDSIPVYVFVNDSQHHVYWYQRFIDYSTGAIMVNGTPHRDYLESHTIPPFSYSGTNYHSGTMHYFLYTATCSFCGGTVSNWISGLCPGNGHCIAPFGMTDLPA